MFMQSTGLIHRQESMRFDEHVRYIPRLLHKLSIAIIVKALTAVMPATAAAQTCSTTSFPYTLTNGATADASQVMADLNCAAIYGLANWGGNIGIGTTSPSVKLQVEGAMSMDGHVIYFRSGATDTNDFVRWNSSFDGLDVAGFNGVNLGYMNTGGYVPTLTVAGGNVGIGTTAPSSALDVVGTITDTGEQINGGGLTFSAVNPSINSGGSYITIPNGLYVSAGTLYAQDALEARGGIYNDEAAYLTIGGGTSGQTYFSGNVGIGTTSPASALSLAANNYAGTSVQFYNTSGNHTFTLGDKLGSLPSSTLELDDNGTPIVDFQAGGNVGIGTTSPSVKLQVEGAMSMDGNVIYFRSGATDTNDFVRWNSSFDGLDVAGFNGVNLGYMNTGGYVPTLTVAGGDVGIGTTKPSYPLYVNGQAGGTTSWSKTSDVRLKKNIVEITGALQLVQKLRGVRFYWKSSRERTVGKTLKLPQGQHEIGFVAQEVAKVIPEVVVMPKTGKDRLYSVKEADLVPLLIEAIKEQQQEISKLQSTVAALQQTISKPSH